MPRKNEFDISIAVMHISGLLSHLELTIKAVSSELSKKKLIQWYLDIFS